MNREEIDSCLTKLDELLGHARQFEDQYAAELAAVHPDYSESARNLVHYVAVRQIDIQGLQNQLTALGLSSLNSTEGHVIASILAVRRALLRISGSEAAKDQPDPREFANSARRHKAHSADLLGANPDGRAVEIMVTLPTEAAGNYPLVHDMIVTGMDVARINCAHDTQDEWLAMIDNVNRSNEETGRKCRIVMDLAGPKVRTGALMPGPGVLRIRPRRDGLGRVIAPKRIRFIADDVPWHGKKLSVVPVPRELIEYAVAGDTVRFRDTRGRNRELKVVDKDEKGLVLEGHKRAYLATGTKLRLKREDSGEKLRFRVGQLPPVELPIILQVGDILMLDDGLTPGDDARREVDGSIVKPAHVPCIPAEVLACVPIGAAVQLNDGKIEGVVEETRDDGLAVRITRAKPTGSRLRADRSINFPGTDLRLRGLTDTDRRNLDFIIEHADAVSLSFVRTPADVIELQAELGKKTKRHIGVIVKIETEEGVNELANLLLAAMRTYPAGIMIARGDLAVECGWERLAMIQEDILWICEAAEIPVVWATQVLEGEAKKGRPSRAEITDAAMAQRADCVMLNKGPHILAAIRLLDKILRSMQRHRH